jgi:multiple sugar transport system ATP-binding protein
MLYVTHDQVEALTLANRIGVLDHGRMVQLGTPQEVYEDPHTVAVASRLGSPRINLLPRAALGQAALPAAVHTVGVRAEHVQLVEAAGAPLRGRVQRIERLSDQYLLHLRLNDTDTELIVSAPPEQLAHAGQEVGIHIVQSLWFDAAGLRVRG